MSPSTSLSWLNNQRHYFRRDITANNTTAWQAARNSSPRAGISAHGEVARNNFHLSGHRRALGESNVDVYPSVSTEESSVVRVHVESVEIAAPAAHTYDFVADIDRLPTWAIGFAKTVDRTTEGDFVVTAGGDRVGIRLVVDPEHGVVDYVMSPKPGTKSIAYTRVVDFDGASLYIFVMAQAPGMADEVFVAQIAELKRELTVLKAHLESACPM